MSDRALSELVDEVVLLFHRLKAAAESIYEEGEASAGRRGVLRSLARLGPQTVPQLARARPVSRQHIQMHVNGLLRDGLIEIADNPAHRRSHLVKLTAAGARRVERTDALDARVTAAVARGLPESRLRDAAEMLRTVRRGFEDEPRWRDALETRSQRSHHR